MTDLPPQNAAPQRIPQGINITLDMPPQQEPPKTDSSFKTRVKSALIFAPMVLVLIYFGGGGFTLMMAAAAAVSVLEWGRMARKEFPYPRGLVQTSAVLAAVSVLITHMVGGYIPGLIFSLALSFVVFAYNYSQHGPRLRVLLGGMIYIIFSITIMVWVRTQLANGLFHFLTLLFIVWASDSFAYISGRAIGGPKLAPSISPKKTWAGFIGSSVGAGAVAAAMAAPQLTFLPPDRTLGTLGMPAYFLLGFVLAMVGQAGDLLISHYKRRFKVKDTGSLIPGHGGLLDRIDALLLVALVFGAIASVLGA